MNNNKSKKIKELFIKLKKLNRYKKLFNNVKDFQTILDHKFQCSNSINNSVNINNISFNKAHVILKICQSLNQQNHQNKFINVNINQIN